ncbi:superoxide dismutase [Facklamia hominis]|uniref:superoxide dismutase n=1 Tax=Facklamia hominis TaxID=178214 RepID=UPI00035287A1|nr:superoxide dismutase [Facklamia hominis]EPH11594.1 hypothetical protein HMPREF9260_00915 [Facklamia hominis ACS-120-V-Sch10]
MSFKLPELPYAYDALEPVIDRATMEFHHDKHHQTYVTNLNKAIEGTNLESQSIESIIEDLEAVPESIRMAVRNNGGGHLNHTLFWESLQAPKEDNQPTGDLAESIKRDFGSFDAFKEEFATAAKGQFGSGWAWLVKDGDQLSVLATPNQDNPLSQGKAPLLGIDVWEHAYYLNYQNRRADYVQAFFEIINWDKIAERFHEA